MDSTDCDCHYHDTVVWDELILKLTTINFDVRSVNKEQGNFHVRSVENCGRILRLK